VHVGEQSKALTQVQAEKVLAEDSTHKVPPNHVGPVYKHWMKKRYARQS
jgi:ubiquinone biosynthesis protein Coq4